MPPRPNLQVEVLDGVDAIPAEAWDALAPPDDPAWSWSTYRAMERGDVGPAGYRHVVVRERDRIVAIQPTFLMPRYPLDETAGPRTRALAGAVRRVWPGFMRTRALFCGHPLGVGLCLGAAEVDPDVVEAILEQLGRVMRDEGMWMLVMKDFAPEHARAYLGAPGGGRLFDVPALPDTVIDLDFDDYEGYLKTLKSAARRNARSKQRKFDTGPAELEGRGDFQAWVPEMCALYGRVYERAAVRLEKLTPAFFQAVADDPTIDAEVLACRDEGGLFAFALCLYRGGRCTNLRIGQDYDRSRETNAYFVLHYETIRRALERGCGRVHFCQTTYGVKLELGCRLEPCTNVVAHRNPLMHAMYRQALRRALRTVE